MKKEDPRNFEEISDESYGIGLPLSMKTRLYLLQFLLLGLVALTTATGLVGIVTVENLTDTSDDYNKGIINVDLTTNLQPNGILRCQYLLVIDTGIHGNRYAAGEVTAELWVGGVILTELKKGSWNITGYPVISGSAYNYSLSWETNLSQLPVSDPDTIIRMITTDPNQTLACTETETELMFLEGANASIDIQAVGEKRFEYTYTANIDTGMENNPYAKGEVILELAVDGTMVEEIGHASWNIAGYPLVPGSSYEYSTRGTINLSHVYPEMVLLATPKDPRKIELNAGAKPDINGSKLRFQ